MGVVEMRLIVSGHREEKIATYDHHWISVQLTSLVGILKGTHGVSLAYSGMASGVDLYFCKACQIQKLPFIACIPFDGQELQMTEEAQNARAEYIKMASSVMHVKNSWMVEHCDIALVVWDGNKGGTHNVVQQLVEKNVPFIWLNPVGKKVWHCT